MSRREYPWPGGPPTAMTIIAFRPDFQRSRGFQPPEKEQIDMAFSPGPSRSTQAPCPPFCCHPGGAKRIEGPASRQAGAKVGNQESSTVLSTRSHETYTAQSTR